MKKMLITLLLAISTGSHATVLKNATDTFPLVSLHVVCCFSTTEKGKR